MAVIAVFGLLASPLALVVVVLAWLVSFYLFPYFVTYRHLRKIPSPFPAQFSNLWLLYAARRGKRYQIVDDIHKKLGPVVRIQPNHVSVADDDAIQVILGHGNGMLKS
jgi:benzoate 4-monooxygenase